MKKLLIGCLLTTVVLAIVGIAGSYWLYRKVSSTVSQFAEFAEVPKIEQQVRNTATFTPPASGELTAAQVERFVGVQAQVRQQLGQRFEEMQRRYKTLFDKPEATVVDLPALMSAYRDLAGTWMDAKRAQTEALNAANFSLEEYRWVRGQAYTALGLPFMDVDVARLVESITSGQAPGEPARMGGSIGPGGPEQNQKLVEPFRKALEDNVALASFGL